MDQIYQRVTEVFAKRIDALFETEDTLKEAFTTLFPGLPFSRTDQWGGIIYKVFRDAWLEAGPEVKGEPTGYDRFAALNKLHRLLDYNLFTQVLLNLQPYIGFAYQSKDAEKDIERMKSEWPKESSLQPFEPKAKMVKEASTEMDKVYNHTLSTLRFLRIIAAFTPQISFRVSPKGSTPALVDSNNISSLGVGADAYLKVLPGLKAFYIHWVPGTSPVWTVPESDGIIVNGITGYLFHSKSGGEILGEVMFSRSVARDVVAAHDLRTETCIVLPRMSSVMVVTDEYGFKLKKEFEKLKAIYPMIELSEGIRAD